MRSILTLAEISQAEIEQIFTVTTELKTKLLRGDREPVLQGRVLALLFEKPSLRTRVSFEAGMAHLGGSCIYLTSDAGWGRRESNADFAKVLSQYVDAVVARVYEHRSVAELAQYSDVPVINGLSDEAHPCQALADLYTLYEHFGSLTGKTLVFMGDGNNVAKSLALGCGRMGMKFVLAAPQNYQFDQPFLDMLAKENPKMELTMTSDPIAAVKHASAVYTDVWASMGQEAEIETRRQAFADYQVCAKLMSHAPSNAYFMHCLPAHRGEEVTADVLDGPRSIVIPQAANRMHAQKGLLTWLLLAKGGSDTIFLTPGKKKK